MIRSRRRWRRVFRNAAPRCGFDRHAWGGALVSSRLVSVCDTSRVRDREENSGDVPVRAQRDLGSLQCRPQNRSSRWRSTRVSTMIIRYLEYISPLRYRKSTNAREIIRSHTRSAVGRSPPVLPPVTVQSAAHLYKRLSCTTQNEFLIHVTRSTVTTPPCRQSQSP